MLKGETDLTVSNEGNLSTVIKEYKGFLLKNVFDLLPMYHFHV